jgi:hypothetical protein
MAVCVPAGTQKEDLPHTHTQQMLQCCTATEALDSPRQTFMFGTNQPC